MAKINTDEFIVVVIEENGRSVQYSTESILFYHNFVCKNLIDLNRDVFNQNRQESSSGSTA